MRIQDAPKLEGWVTLAEVADILGISRQHAWRMAAAQPSKWETLHQIGNSNVYVVSLEEVRQRGARRSAHNVTAIVK